MNFFNEYALLVAVALPVVTIVGLQAFLLVGGERGTGLLPGFNRYPSIDVGHAAAAVELKPVVCEPATIMIAIAPSNDEVERLAA